MSDQLTPHCCSLPKQCCILVFRVSSKHRVPASTVAPAVAPAAILPSAILQCGTPRACVLLPALEATTKCASGFLCLPLGFSVPATEGTSESQSLLSFKVEHRSGELHIVNSRQTPVIKLCLSEKRCGHLT